MKIRRIFLLNFVLLPAFFVFHGYNENYPFVTAGVALILLCTYVVAAVILFAVSALLLRSAARAAIFVFIILSFNFFFGSFQDWLKSVPELKALSAYRVLLPVIFVATLFSFFMLRRTKADLSRFNGYLFSLMLLLIIFESFALWNQPAVNDGNPQVYARTGKAGPQPDIYFILLDSYAGSRSLMELCHYDNSSMVTALRSKGFFVCANSHSNYNFTPFSMASSLNMRFLTDIKNVNACDAADYARCGEEIKNNAVTAFLVSRGYDPINYSVFDLKGQPSPVHETFLPLKGRLISDQTLLNRMKRDLLHLLIVGKYAVKWFRPDVYTTLYNNNRLIRLTKQAAASRSPRPRFIYLHLYMPHAPYYYNENGKLKDPEAINADEEARPEVAFVDNLRVTNRMLEDLVDTILTSTHRKAVILLAGDHGFRPRRELRDNGPVFNNLHAVYLPAGRYDLYDDSLSNVNMFPVLFNSIFDTRLPLLKDSTVFLRDRK